MKKANAILLICFLASMLSLMIVWKKVDNRRMQRCVDATRTPNYQMINAKLYCETPKREWIELGEAE